jgi:hypothetical protein
MQIKSKIEPGMKLRHRRFTCKALGNHYLALIFKMKFFQVEMMTLPGFFVPNWPQAHNLLALARSGSP